MFFISCEASKLVLMVPKDNDILSLDFSVLYNIKQHTVEIVSFSSRI